MGITLKVHRTVTRDGNKKLHTFFIGKTLNLQVGTCESRPKTLAVSKRTTLQYLLKTHLVYFVQI